MKKNDGFLFTDEEIRSRPEFDQKLFIIDRLPLAADHLIVGFSLNGDLIFEKFFFIMVS